VDIHFFSLILVIALTIAYSGPLLYFALGFRRTRKEIVDDPTERVRVSILIPARNEENNITECLSSILANRYPVERTEILVIDDSSDDHTADRVLQFGESSVRLISLDPSSGGGKKRAIAAGIAASNGEVILTTDADCRVGPDWIMSMIGRMDDSTGLVAGPVLFRTDGSFFSKAVAMEYMGLAIVSAGSIGMKTPVSCSGANMAYRREAFEAVGGYEGNDHLASGDDDFLLHRIARQTDLKIRYCLDRCAIVETAPPETPRAFLNQRIRWASKTFHYEKTSIFSMELLICIVLASIPLLLLTAVLVPVLWPKLAMVLVLKMISELFVLIPAARFFQRPGLLSLLVFVEPFQILYVPYVVVASILGSFEWKGRILQR